MSNRICLVSHQHLFRTLLRDHLVQHLAAEIVAEVDAAAPLLALTVCLNSVDLFIIDADLADASPLPVLCTLRARHPAAKIALITDVPGAYLADCVFRLELSGLLHKRDTLEQFVGAVQSILAGGLVVSSHIDLRGRSVFRGMVSDREIEVLALMAQGYAPSQIATQLEIVPDTVVKHKRACMVKLSIKTHHGLILFALASGLVSADQARCSRP